jgi:hypothetical protein
MMNVANPPSRHWSPALAITVSLSICSYFVCVLLLQQWHSVDGFIVANSATFRTYANVLAHLPTWAVMLPVTVAALLPDVADRNGIHQKPML